MRFLIVGREKEGVLKVLFLEGGRFLFVLLVVIFIVFGVI